MSMEVTAWMSLHHAMNQSEERRKFSVETLRRILGFARPHRRDLTIFLLLSVASAVLIVATPVLAGRVVDVIVGNGEVSTVIQLSVIIALIALLEAAVGPGRFSSSA